jgi:hypothetical protein
LPFFAAETLEISMNHLASLNTATTELNPVGIGTFVKSFVMAEYFFKTLINLFQPLQLIPSLKEIMHKSKDTKS